MRPIIIYDKERPPNRVVFLCYSGGSRTGAGVNGLPVAIQSRDPASAAAEVDSHHPLHVVADFVSFATTIFFVIAHSLRRSSFQNQNRTAASCLVDSFGIPLCWFFDFV
jgi:hypothetical protein